MGKSTLEREWLLHEMPHAQLGMCYVISGFPLNTTVTLATLCVPNCQYECFSFKIYVVWLFYQTR